MPDLDFAAWDTPPTDGLDIFLDSGAFTAYTGGAIINIEEYCDFIHQNKHRLSGYASLDVIGDPEGSLHNYEHMRASGLDPVPVFHRGSDFKYLERYIKATDYIALGGVVTKAPKHVILSWLDYTWERYLTDMRGYPVAKVHGFGLGSPDYVFRYPWYSVDSSSWRKTASIGKAWIPHETSAGTPLYNQLPYAVFFGVKMVGTNHYLSLPPEVRRRVDVYLQSLGFVDGSELLDGNGISKWWNRSYVNAHFLHGMQQTVRFKPFARSGGFFASVPLPPDYPVTDTVQPLPVPAPEPDPVQPAPPKRQGFFN